MQFLLENPMPQELHFLADLNSTVGFGKVRVVAVWHIDVTQCCDGQIYPIFLLDKLSYSGGCKR